MVTLDPLTQQRIEGLLRELRGWHPSVPEASLAELCERFSLPELVVLRLAHSEGFDLAVNDPAPRSVDPLLDDTRPIDPKSKRE